MARNANKSTLLRQWEMMRMLTVSRSDNRQDGRWDKASGIAGRLNNAGYLVSVRTVQRDLKELSEIFPIDLNDKNPSDYGWRWRKGANLDLPGMGVAESLGMRMIEMHLGQLLPTSMLDGLQGLFSLANEKLRNLKQNGSNHSADWMDKVRIVPSSQPLLPPPVDYQAHADITQALLENRQIAAGYRPMGSVQPKQYRLHPLALIMRGPVSYLVASAWDYAEVRLYAMHRFTSAEVLTDAVIAPCDFNLDRAIAHGLAEFANEGNTIDLELLCNEELAAYLAETPLSVDQRADAADPGWQRVRATVNDSWQLRWWILGQGAGVEVCAPLGLREEITSVLRDALAIYSSDR
jgi:predicted DNA-binding transcriptional regulator YafY